MGKAGAARKLASAAAFGGGGLSVLGAGLYGVLRAEATLARRTIGNADDRAPPDSTGWYGRGRPGPAIKVALLGDSSAAGYGVDRVVETPGAHLASGLAAGADRRVYLRSFAKVGAQSSDLAGQIDRALPTDPDLAVILVGANDVTHRVRPSQSVRYLADGGTPAPRGRRARCWSAPAPTSAPSSRSRRRSSRSPGPGRAGSPPPRRSRPSRRAASRSRSARSSARTSRRRPARAVRTRPVPPVGRGLPRARRRCWCPAPSTRWASATTSRAGVPAARARCRSPRPPSARPRTPGTELGDKKGLWVELRRRARLRSVPEAPPTSTRTPNSEEDVGQRRMIARMRSRLV